MLVRAFTTASSKKSVVGCCSLPISCIWAFFTPDLYRTPMKASPILCAFWAHPCHCWTPAVQNCHVDQIVLSPPVIPPKSLPSRTPSAAPGLVLPSLLFFSSILCLFYFSYSLNCFSLSLLSDISLLFLSLVSIPYRSLKGKPLCFTYSGAPSPLMVALPVITILFSSPSSSPPFFWHSSFFPGWWLTNRFTPLYPN